MGTQKAAAHRVDHVDHVYGDAGDLLRINQDQQTVSFETGEIVEPATGRQRRLSSQRPEFVHFGEKMLPTNLEARRRAGNIPASDPDTAPRPSTVSRAMPSQGKRQDPPSAVARKCSNPNTVVARAGEFGKLPHTRIGSILFRQANLLTK